MLSFSVIFEDLFGINWELNCCLVQLVTLKMMGTEVVNRTLSTMLRAVLDKNLRCWEDCLPHVELAYNRATHSSTKMCPFQIVYGYIPRAPIDLFSLDAEDTPHIDVVAHVEQMIDLHEHTHQNIAVANAKYQVAGSKGRNMLLLHLVIWFGCI
jgi:hypothetical protein